MGIGFHITVFGGFGRNGRRNRMTIEEALETKRRKYEELDCSECCEKDCPYREESNPDYCPNLEGD